MPTTGDEPHYLIAAHSLVVEGDLSLKENYLNRDYRIFHPGELAKRTTFNPDRSKELPAFSPGLSFFLTPFYYFAFHYFPSMLVPFLRCLMCAITAFALYQVMLFFRDLAGSENGILQTVPAFALACPVLTYSSLFYPEVLAFLLLVIALREMHAAETRPWICAVLLALISAALVWVHPKYIALSFILFLLGVRRLSIASRNHEASLAAVRITHAVLSLIGIVSFFLFLNAEYGSWSPNRIYGGAQKETSLIELLTKEGVERLLVMVRMIPGYFLDQRFGIIVYAPVYIAFFPALVWSIHKEETKLSPLVILFSAHFLLLSWGAQMGGFAPPSRHFVVMVPFLMIPILITYSSWNRFQKGLFFLLAGIGLAIAGLILMNYRLVYTNATWRNPDGFSEFWQNFGLQHWIPRFTSSPPDYLQAAIWIAITAGIGYLLYPTAKFGGRASVPIGYEPKTSAGTDAGPPIKLRP
jgi:hypothetical protein